MNGETSSEPAPPVPSMALAVRTPSGLARRRAGVLLAARRAALALTRREPAALLALGVGAGLLARAVLGAAAHAGRGDSRPARPGDPIGDPADAEAVSVDVETLVVRVTRVVAR